MKQRYISLVLSVVVLFLSAGILIVRGQQSYVAPTETFPSGLKEPPLDTGGTPQEKANYLSPTQINLSRAGTQSTGILMKTNQSIRSGTNSIIPDATGNISLLSSTGNILLTGTSGNLIIDAQGVVLPSKASDPATPTPGMIYYDSTGDGKVKLYNKKGWTDIGTGSGGDLYWKPGNGGITYNGGDISIFGPSPVNSGNVDYYAAGKLEINNNKEHLIPYDFNPKSASADELAKYWGKEQVNNRMSCDTGFGDVADCSSINGLFLENNSSSAKKYDLFVTIFKLQGYAGTCSPLPNGDSSIRGNCAYYASFAEFNKQTVGGEIVFYYTQTDLAGGYSQNQDSSGQIPLPDYPSMVCDADAYGNPDPFNINCPSVYTTGVNVTSPSNAMDRFERTEYVCARYRDNNEGCATLENQSVDYAKVYTLQHMVLGVGRANLNAGGIRLSSEFELGTTVEKNIFANGGNLESFTVNAPISQCNADQRGMIRSFQSSSGDRFCYCRKSSVGSYEWLCF